MTETKTARKPEILFKRRSRVWKRIRKNLSCYMLLLLPVGLTIIFRYIPMYGAQIAFRDYKVTMGFWKSPWVGLKHFRSIGTNFLFWRALRNTLTIALGSFVTFPAPIIFALIVHNVPFRKLNKTVQMITYIPHFISTVVVASIVIIFFSPRGIINGMLGSLDINFLGSPSLFVPLYLSANLWQGIGFGSIIFIAALSGINPELHEAAVIDGASLLRRVWHIELPALFPMIVIMLIMKFGSLLNSDTERILLLQNSLNISASEVIGTYVYKQALTAQVPQYSQTTAIGLSLSVVNLLLLTLVNRIAAWLTDTSLW